MEIYILQKFQRTIFNLFYRRRLGRPLQPQTADYPLRRPDCSRHPAYVPYYAVSN